MVFVIDVLYTRIVNQHGAEHPGTIVREIGEDVPAFAPLLEAVPWAIRVAAIGSNSNGSGHTGRVIKAESDPNGLLGGERKDIIEF